MSDIQLCDRPQMTQIESESRPPQLAKVLEHIEELLLETWRETGYGELIVQSDRSRQNKIRVTIKGGTYYRYTIADEEVQNWKSQ